MSEPSPKKKTSFYDQVKAIDIIDPVLELFVKGGFDADLVKRKFILKRDISLPSPWVFAKFCPDRKCGKWLDLYHKYYQILPPPCKLCWKVVIAPQTIEDLMEVHKFQVEINLPAKAGLEARDYTSGLGGYRAFWYCPYGQSLKLARIYYSRIKNALIKHFNEDYILYMEKENKLYLKRGCTELERDFGPSDKWDDVDYSHKFNLLESVWEDPVEMEIPFAPLRYTNFKRWIEFAVAYGDPTVGKYLSDPRIGVQSVKYHNSDHEDRNYDFSHIPLNEKDEDKENESDEGTGKEKNLLELELE